MKSDDWLSQSSLSTLFPTRPRRWIVSKGHNCVLKVNIALTSNKSIYSLFWATVPLDRGEKKSAIYHYVTCRLREFLKQFSGWLITLARTESVTQPVAKVNCKKQSGLPGLYVQFIQKTRATVKTFFAQTGYKTVCMMSLQEVCGLAPETGMLQHSIRLSHSVIKPRGSHTPCQPIYWHCVHVFNFATFSATLVSLDSSQLPSWTESFVPSKFQPNRTATFHLKRSV